MIFQEPMTSLNPLHTIGRQIGEVLVILAGMSRTRGPDRAIELLEKVGIRRRRSDSTPTRTSSPAGSASGS